MSDWAKAEEVAKALEVFADEIYQRTESPAIHLTILHAIGCLRDSLKRPAPLDGECEKNPDHFPRGARVRMSRLGKDRFSKCADRIGTIVSYYPREQLVSIRWDGYKTVNRMHIDFLEPLPAAPSTEKAEGER